MAHYNLIKLLGIITSWCMCLKVSLPCPFHPFVCLAVISVPGILIRGLIDF